jgi:hypothetical protein
MLNGNSQLKMSQTFEHYFNFIFIYVLVFLMIISFSLFTIFFFKHKTLQKKTKKIIKSYTTMKSFNHNVSFNIFKIYGTNNVNIREMYSILQNIKTDLNSKIDDFKEKLLLLKKYVNNFQHKNANKIISTYFLPHINEIEKAQDIIKLNYDNFDKCINETNDICVSLVSLQEKVTDFYKTKIFPTKIFFQNTKILNARTDPCQCIEKNLADISDELEQLKILKTYDQKLFIDKSKTIKSMQSNLLLKMKILFKYSRLIYHFESIKKQIVENLVSINDPESISSINQQLVIGDIAFEKFTNVVKDLDFNNNINSESSLNAQCVMIDKNAINI